MEKITFQDINKAKEVFEHLQDYAKKYEQSDMQKELDMIQPKLKLEHKIAIVKNENAGKRTFIKAVFGEEIPTESTLSDADIALFVLDYEQLDTSLENDEQGLWHTIQERVAKDKDFDVFFILNKIDIALNNAESTGDWYSNRQKAVEEIKKVAMRHGIQNPQIYPVSSLYCLLEHKIAKNFDEDDELDENLILFIKYASLKKEFEFTPTSIIHDAKLKTTALRFGRMLNANMDLLQREGLYITKNRTSDKRIYHCVYEEPNLEDDE